jgi:uncharacterized alpha/beta hydrolase family protein
MIIIMIIMNVTIIIEISGSTNNTNNNDNNVLLRSGKWTNDEMECLLDVILINGRDGVVNNHLFIIACSCYVQLS